MARSGGHCRGPSVRVHIAAKGCCADVCAACRLGLYGSSRNGVHVQHHHHQARALLRMVQAATRTMHAEGDLTSQMHRAAISVLSNIAEGSERGNDREFRHFLAIANASAAEVEAQIIIASDIDSLGQATANQIAEQCRCVGRMPNRLLAKVEAGG